jgi:hypothetical protein
MNRFDLSLPGFRLAAQRAGHLFQRGRLGLQRAAVVPALDRGWMWLARTQPSNVAASQLVHLVGAAVATTLQRPPPTDSC